tara:strand:+ start:4645 stop:5034 length:390 start_codon:yes stop_codon:yes gene_type:complete
MEGMSYFHKWEDFPKKINPKKGNSGEIVSTEKVLVKRGRVEPGVNFDGSLHRHQEDQFMVMISGKLKMKIDTEEDWIENGGFSVIPGNVWHGLLEVGKEGAEYYEIMGPGRMDYLMGFVGIVGNEYKSK